MSEKDQLRETLTGVLDQVGRQPLKNLLFEAIEPAYLDDAIARLSYFVAPSYLPFATYDGALLVFYLWPGRAIEESPVLFVPTDDQQARYVCDRLANLPSALWLWVGRYFHKKPDVLREATDTMAQQISGGKKVSEKLWEYFEDKPGWWNPTSNEQTNKAWVVAGTGHPFAGYPDLSEIEKPKEALKLIEPLVTAHPDVPELLAMLIATRSKANLSVKKDDALKVLSAEAWRNLHLMYNAPWRRTGKGIAEWDSTLNSLKNPEEMLENTPFAVLASNLKTYSGEDKNGPKTLQAIADTFLKDGDSKNTLRQLRNAATLSILTKERYSKALAKRIADTCEAISEGSLAGAIAAESARLYNVEP